MMTPIVIPRARQHGRLPTEALLLSFSRLFVRHVVTWGRSLIRWSPCCKVYVREQEHGAHVGR